MLKMLLFHEETISAKFLWGNVLFGGMLQIGAKNSNFEIFESALNMKSVSMPLNIYHILIAHPCPYKCPSITFLSYKL